MYRIKCKDCHSTYIGDTKRKLQSRIIEHMTNKNKQSGVFISLHKREFPQKHLIAEMVYIHDNKKKCKNKKGTFFILIIFKDPRVKGV